MSFRVDSPRRPRRWKKYAIITAVSFVFLAAGTAGFAYYRYQQLLKPVSVSIENVIVTIPEGYTARQIGDLLEAKGVIQSGFVFDVYTRLEGVRGDLQAGAYEFQSAQSVEEITRKIINGEVATDLVTILPAQRVDQIKSMFQRKGFERDEINTAFSFAQYKNHPALAYLPPATTSLEGYIYPESFQVSADSTVKEVVELSLDEMAGQLTPDIRSKFAELGLTVHQAVTLASIVEQETSAGSPDRATVAQVYLKRLNEGMLLQADPTAQYGKFIATATDEGWLTYDSPYNTYLYAGLPPGPISNVSESALKAVANPTDTDYLFFVADDTDDNKTHFARTFAEHEANIAKYCQVKCTSY